MTSSNRTEIELNGEAKLIKTGSSIEELLTEMAVNRGLKARSKALAVELNTEIVPQNCFETTVLKSGDKLEVVTLVGGG